MICAELFTKLLDSKGLRYASGTLQSGDTMIEIPIDGNVAKCIFCGENGKYYSFYLFFDKVPPEKMADVLFVCNDLNTQYKWATFYVNKSGDVVVHDDAILSVESAADEAFELVLRLLDIAKKSKPLIMKAIFA